EFALSDEVLRYGGEHVQLLATPRATGSTEYEGLLAHAKRIASATRAYMLSSNRISNDGVFNGASWIIDPSGDVLTLTTRQQPFASVDIDLTHTMAHAAGATR
ncbi:MAG TPA: hypothetical protein VKB34_03140, partial [Povalibacter sp.]|nr:hypothetical protein [Povalibacter sp.]